MAVNVLPQVPAQLQENLRSTTETGKDDDRLSRVHIVEPSEALSTRVYVGNLGYDVDDRDLYYFFYHFGPVEHARVIVNRNGFSKGYGFVTFHGQEVAKNVVEVAKRDGIWMNGRMLRVGAARKSHWAREVGPGHTKRRVNDNKVCKNVDTSDTPPAEYQSFSTNDDGSSVSTASYPFYCYPTQPASYPVYYQPPYPQISGQDMPYYPAPWHSMSYSPTQSYTVPISLAPAEPSYSNSSYEYRDAALTEQPTGPYWEHQDTYMYMVTYDNTLSINVQWGNSSVEDSLPTENHHEGVLYPEVSNRNNIQSYHQLEWGTGAKTDNMDTHMDVNTGDSYLGDSGFQESVLDANESQGQGTAAVSIGQDEEESRDNVVRLYIGEETAKNYQNSKEGGGSTINKNSTGNEPSDCRKIVNDGGSEGPCLESTPDMLKFQSSLEKLEIK